MLRSQRTESARKKADALLAATRQYAEKWVEHSENAVLADSTGFAPEGVRTALQGLSRLEEKLSPADWEPGSLFGDTAHSSLPNLIGVMMHIPELRSSLEEITSTGLTKSHIAEITTAWVNGQTIREIADRYFRGRGASVTEGITAACKAIYRTLVNSGPWGLSALSKLPTSGLDFDRLPEDVAKRLNALPAMIYYGVRTEAAVLMRMNSAPRSVAEALGARYDSDRGQTPPSARSARAFLKSLEDNEWATAAPRRSPMSGADYRRVWEQLSGEANS